jgi:hypothetical protein
MEAVSDRSEENRETEFAAPSAGEKTESAVSAEPLTDPSVSAQPTTATNALPGTPAAKANHLRPVANDLRAERANKGLDPSKVIPRRKARDRGPSNPLLILATKEAALRVDAAALAELSRAQEFSPDQILFQQLTGTVAGGPIDSWYQRKVVKGAIDLYSALGPRDVIDSIMARTIVGLTNATMDCFKRASQTSNPAAQELNLRYGMKGAGVLDGILQRYQNRGRISPPNVTVGEVTVEAGGKAIVGNLESGDRQISTRQASVSRKKSRKKDWSASLFMLLNGSEDADGRHPQT